MSYRDRPRMWKVAYYILADEGACALPIGEPVVSHAKGGGKVWQEWAIDMRRKCPDSILAAFDDHYLTPSNEYRRIPTTLKPHVRAYWKTVQECGLYRHGLRIVESCYG